LRAERLATAFTAASDAFSRVWEGTDQRIRVRGRAALSRLKHGFESRWSHHRTTRFPGIPKERGTGPCKHMPSDGDLVDLFPRMALEPELRYKILVEHPARLRGF